MSAKPPGRPGVISRLRTELAGVERDIRADVHDRGRLEHELAQLARAQAQHVNHAVPLPRWGVDYAWAHPNPDALRRAHVTFAARYLTGGQGKALTRAEATGLAAAGIDLVAIFETTAERMRGGYGAGATDAREAFNAHVRVSPKANGRPIYFACDFDAAGAGALGPVMEYLRGAVHTIGWHRVGVYGGLGVVDAAHGLNRCPFRWQTLAWSSGRWSPHAQLQQRVNGAHVAGAEVDMDKAVAGDFGQWRA